MDAGAPPEAGRAAGSAWRKILTWAAMSSMAALLKRTKRAIITKARKLLFSTKSLREKGMAFKVHSAMFDSTFHHTWKEAHADSALPLPPAFRVRLKVGDRMQWSIEPHSLPNTALRSTSNVVMEYAEIILQCSLAFDESCLPTEGTDYTLVQDSKGYIVRFKTSVMKTNTRLTKKLHVGEVVSEVGSIMMITFIPQFTATPKGLVLESAQVEMVSPIGSGSMDFDLEYATIEGSPLPAVIGAAMRRIRPSGDFPHSSFTDTLRIGDYTFTKK